MLNTAVKRGRGRPRKNEMAKVTIKKAAKKSAKKRGRPLGSKNKVSKLSVEERLLQLEMIAFIILETIKSGSK